MRMSLKEMNKRLGWLLLGAVLATIAILYLDYQNPRVQVVMVEREQPYSYSYPNYTPPHQFEVPRRRESPPPPDI